MAQRSAVLGVDAGGTKTAGRLASLDGSVLAESQDGPGNYQATGLDVAKRVYGRVLAPLRLAADRAGVHIAAAAFGLSGLDRPRDAARLEPLLRELVPEDIPLVAVNDTFLILRAGTTDGVGVGLVSGTGSNCVGVGRDGRRTRIGGLGGDFGDDGSADSIGRLALRAAFRGDDGRARPTALTAMLKESLGLDRLDDIVDRFIVDAGVRLSTGLLAPLVFEAAASGDAVAHDILVESGRELALSASTIARRLFASGEVFPLVMGGSVLQKGVAAVDTMERALVERVRQDFPRVEPVRLAAPPIAGAVMLAADAAKERGA